MFVYVDGSNADSFPSKIMSSLMFPSNPFIVGIDSVEGKGREEEKEGREWIHAIDQVVTQRFHLVLTIVVWK